MGLSVARWGPARVAGIKIGLSDILTMDFYVDTYTEK